MHLIPGQNLYIYIININISISSHIELYVAISVCFPLKVHNLLNKTSKHNHVDNVNGLIGHIIHFPPTNTKCC